jgi:hypothetical protein
LGQENRIRRNTKHGQCKRGDKTPEWLLWESAKQRAKKKGLQFTLTLEDICIPEKCPVLGIPLEVGVKKRCDNSPSLDKKDPSGGYTPENVWVISWRANRIKCDGTLEELEMIVKALKKERKEVVHG